MPIQQISLSQEQATDLVTYLDRSLETIQTRREARSTSWAKYNEQYDGAVQKQKNFPWPGASNVHVPITSIIVDAVHANMMNRIFGFERIWDVKAYHPKTQVGVDTKTAQPILSTDLAKAFQDYLNFEGSESGTMDVYEPAEDAILECVKLGTSVIYNPWLSLSQPEHQYDQATGEIRINEPTAIFDGIQPRLLALEDFIILPHYPEIHGPQASPLFGHHYWLREGELAARQEMGWYRTGALDRVLASPGMGTSDERVKDDQARMEGDPDTYTDLRRNDFRLQDLWLRYPLLKRGLEFRLFVTYHWKSRTIMRVQPWIYKTPPYVPMRYVRRQGRFYGIGIPEMLESIQRGVNTSFNQAVDNATVANMRCFVVREGTKASRLFGSVYPGKKFLVDSMDDIKDFQLGEVYPSIFQVGLLLRDFAERRTGITDFNLGRESEVLGRGSTATTTMALLQEGSRRFDLYAKDIRRAIGELGMQSTELIQQFKPVERIYTTMGEDAELVERAISLPEDVNLRQHFSVISTSSSSSANKEIARQNALTAFGLLTQYLERLFSLAVLMVNPQMPEPLKKLAYDMSQTGEKLMQRVLEGFDLPDIASLLPQLEGLLNATQGQAQGTNGPQGVAGLLGSPGGAAGGVDPSAALGGLLGSLAGGGSTGGGSSGTGGGGGAA